MGTIAIAERLIPLIATTFLVFVTRTGLCQDVRSLSDERWTLSGGALNRTVNAGFPSQVHLDLLNAGVIGECWLIPSFGDECGWDLY